MQTAVSGTSGEEASYWDLITFFVPIAAMTMIMMSSHNIISSALARTRSAEVALASYSVAQSISSMIQSPCWALTRVCVPLYKDKQSYANVNKVAYSTFAIVLGLMLLIAFTPISKIVFCSLLGISESLLPETIKTFRVFLIMPIFSAMRAIYQGLITVSRKTHLLTLSVIIRLASMFLIATFLTQTEIVSGGVIGAIILVVGFTTEVVIAVVTGRKFKNALPDKPEFGNIADVRSIWIFFIPLVAAQFMEGFANPSISAGLARTTDPETSIASFYVARSFAWIFLGLGFRIHQIVIVFVRDYVSWIRVKKFVLGLGVLFAIVLFSVSLTPAGRWILINIIGTSPDLAQPALQAMIMLAFVPIVMFAAELYEGLLLHHKRASGLTISKISNVLALAATIFVFGSLFPSLGAVLGSLGVLSGFVVELAVALWLSRDIVLREGN